MKTIISIVTKYVFDVSVTVINGWISSSIDPLDFSKLNNLSKNISQ